MCSVLTYSGREYRFPNCTRASDIAESLFALIVTQCFRREPNRSFDSLSAATTNWSINSIRFLHSSFKMAKQIDYQQLITLPAIFRIVALIFNIVAIAFARISENPYYASNTYIKFDGIATAGACFSAITLAVAVLSSRLRGSLQWLCNELLIQCALIIAYIYGCVHMVIQTQSCYQNVKGGCPRLLTATITGNLAVLTYIIDGGFKLREFRRRSRAQRLAAVNGDEAKVEEPYVDEEAAVEIPAVQT